MRVRKWVFIILLSMGMALLWGCVGEEREATPSEDLTVVLKAFQAQDYETAGALTGRNVIKDIETQKQGFAIVFSPASKAHAMELVDTAYEKTSAFTFSIRDEVIQGDHALVTIEITNVDLSASLEGTTGDVMENVLKKVPHNSSPRYFESELINEFAEKIHQTSMKSETIEVYMIKEESTGRWKLSDHNDALMQAVTGYMPRLM